MTREYWVMFEREPLPIKIVTTSLDELLDTLRRLMVERGAIAWMTAS